MSDDEQAIEDWFKRNYAKAVQQHGKRLPREVEIELSDEYKRRHQALIDARHKAEAAAMRDENNDRVCEVCYTKLPVHRGRPAKRCEEHRV